ncbi:MAG: cbb3-type cytochrome c oxidase subunit I [Chitinophagaceae bacterium]
MKISNSLKTVIGLEIIIPIILLIVGIYNGLTQVLYRANVLHANSFLGIDYYQGLTLHGVINALVLTTFIIVAFGNAVMSYYLKIETGKKASWLALILMVIGTLMAAAAMLLGKASVLYTFYAPLHAHFTYYLGAALLIVGSWVSFFDYVVMYLRWRKANPTVEVPLAVHGNLVNFTIWFFCTLPVAYLVLVMLIPWSMGLVDSVNPTLARTLFWFFGHPLVYFWALSSYIMLYCMLPQWAGGKLYSANMGRFTFFIFLILSIPIGLHHQFQDPGISSSYKFIHSALTLFIGVPSALTAFTIAASLEYAARKRGAKGWFNWMFKLPFFDTKNFMFSYLICGLLLFLFGGVTGLINGSYALNNVIHNTAWLPGHFHTTVGGLVFLSLIGIALYLITQVYGKELKCKNWAVAVPYLWLIGVLIFSVGLSWGGLIGEPRRTNLGLTYLDPTQPDFYRPEWVSTTTMTMIGGIIMTGSMLVYFIVFFKTLFSKSVNESNVIEFPEIELIHPEKKISIFQKYTPWVIILILAIIISYTPAIIQTTQTTVKDAPGFMPNSPTPISSSQK